MTADHAIRDVEVGPGDPATDVDVETLRSGLQSETAGTRLTAANVASFVPAEDVETLKPVVPELRDLLTGEQDATIYQSVMALQTVADDDASLVEEDIPRLVELLGHDNSLVRSAAAMCLASVAMDRPEYVAEQLETLVAVTIDDPGDAVDEDDLDNPDLEEEQWRSLMTVNWEEGVRGQVPRDVAANLLVEVAKYDPSLLAPYSDELVEVLEDGPLSVKTAIADVVAQMAKEDVADVSGAVEPLCDLFDVPQEPAIATAVTALGFIGDPDAVEPLRELAADEERDEDLRALASETADFIEA